MISATRMRTRTWPGRYSGARPSSHTPVAANRPPAVELVILLRNCDFVIDPKSEKKLGTLELEVYVPRDESFGHIKKFEYFQNIGKKHLPYVQATIKYKHKEFESFKDVHKLYEGGYFPMPQVIQNDKWAWKTDEEFAREMLAGVNPIIIQLLKEFPPVSMLDPKRYGNQNSTIKLKHIERNLDGLSVQQALDHNRLFILDHHDSIVPYLRRINTTESKVYATRTILFLKEDSTLKPLAIELSLPNPDGDTLGVISNVYTPASFGIEGSIWTLAKAYVTINDSCIHELISHWLRTHAVIEPFVIATNRHLSVMHPINKLLVPQYRDTMKINALARQTLVNAGGHLESLLFPSKYALEMSATVYKSWNFIEQGLPSDLLKRGMAVEDPSRPHKLRLLIEDYPYAVDGLAIWSAIKTWVCEYCDIYYQDDSAVECDEELQAWWKEVLEVGHGDKKDEPWWPKMRSVPELVNSCSTIIWVASAMHAAVNFGQYSYAGYMPNRPTMSRQFMPEVGSAEYEELQKNPEKVFLETITYKQQTVIEMNSLIKTLSTHSSDEVYLGQRVSAEWARDERAIDALNRFCARLKEIEKMIAELNSDPTLKNRNGPVKMPYTLLSPYSDTGITGKGIPNSISL